jgi:DNA-binding transcriptional ArsR family regulator
VVTEKIARRVLDATALQGLAHPLRVQLCDQLSLHGPATATQLAARLNESSGATSYHLRQLEKYGFVEEDPGRGSGRERWWRRVPGRISIEGHTLADESPAARDATRLVMNEFSRAKQARIQEWRDTYERWPRAWADGSIESSNHLRLTAAEFTQLGQEIDAVITAWVERTRDRQGDGVADVEVQWYSYPVGDPPAETDG